MTENVGKKCGNIPKMNCRWRVIITLTIILVVWATIYFCYNRPKKHLELKLELTDKVKISVYYEALCPDSKYFITRQLSPLYEKIPQHIILDMIPYGKAQTIESEGSITFQCQHDELECYANKIHACVIDLVRDPSTQLNYVACMITRNQNPDNIGKLCGEEYKIDFTPILNCAKGEKGSLLLKGHGERTHALNPPVDFIPTIELNNSQAVVPLRLILKNLQNAVCGLFRTKPANCDN